MRGDLTIPPSLPPPPHVVNLGQIPPKKYDKDTIRTPPVGGGGVAMAMTMRVESPVRGFRPGGGSPLPRGGLLGRTEVSGCPKRGAQRSDIPAAKGGDLGHRTVSATNGRDGKGEGMSASVSAAAGVRGGVEGWRRRRAGSGRGTARAPTPRGCGGRNPHTQQSDKEGRPPPRGRWSGAGGRLRNGPGWSGQLGTPPPHTRGAPGPWGEVLVR